MIRYKTVLFDLDGTITDSGTGIMNAIRYAVRKYGLAEPEEAVLRSFIGPPLKEQFRKVFGLSEEEGRRMVALYREYYGEKGIFENRVYDGVPEMLDTLKRAGIRILMATSKPEKYAELIADQSHDIIGAKKCGLHSIGVLYGYGSREELETSGAERIADTPGAAAEMILSSR